MSPESYIFLKSSVQYLSTLFSVSFNLFLIFLVQTKSPKRMGTYKYLMIYFSIFAILFTCLETVAEPYGHTHGCTFLVIIKTETSLISPEVASILICLLIGCFGFTISMIAVHFIFRFFALERKGKLKYFKAKFLPIWFVIPILIGVNHTLLCWYVFRPTKELSDYVRESIHETYNFSIDLQTYAGGYFYPPDASGTPTFNWDVGFAFVNIAVLATASFSILTYCGVRSYLKIKSLIHNGKSTYTRNLQKQLYKALVVQASIPTLLMFIPIGIFVTAPFFYLNVTWMSKVATITYALYPAIDPIPIIYIVDEYRKATIEIFNFKRYKPNRIAQSREEISTSTISGNHVTVQN